MTKYSFIPCHEWSGDMFANTLSVAKDFVARRIFLASGEADFVTGSAYDIDGGFLHLR